MSSQHAFLSRIRRALQSDPKAAASRPPLLYRGAAAPIAATIRERLLEQRAALVAQLQEELTAAGGACIRVDSGPEAVTSIRRIAEEAGARRVVRWHSELLQALEVDAALQEDGVTVHAVPAPGPDPVTAQTRQAMREVVCEADLGLSGVDWVIAETGTLALLAHPGQMRGVSLLPRVHVAVARTEQIVASMADGLQLLQMAGHDLQRQLSSCVSFITGPSRTGDIELTLTVGVHGPGALHLVLLDTPIPA